MKRFFEGEKFLAEGEEKKVFEVPAKKTRPDMVVSYFRDKERQNEGEIKAKYYLTKILHFLFPKNVPDIYFSSKRALLTEKVDTGDRHRRFMELNKGEENLTQSEREELYVLRPELEEMVKYSQFVESLKRLNLNYDGAFFNFGFDGEGNIKYVDSFDPWFVNKKGVLCRGYDVEALTQAIEALPEDPSGDQKTNFSLRKKERARKYLVELEKLFLEEEKVKKCDTGTQK